MQKTKYITKGKNIYNNYNNDLGFVVEIGLLGIQFGK